MYFLTVLGAYRGGHATPEGSSESSTASSSSGGGPGHPRAELQSASGLTCFSPCCVSVTESPTSSIKTPVIGFRVYLVWPHLNLITSAGKLCSNKVIFTGIWGQEFSIIFWGGGGVFNPQPVLCPPSAGGLCTPPKLIYFALGQYPFDSHLGSVSFSFSISSNMLGHPKEPNSLSLSFGIKTDIEICLPNLLVASCEVRCFTSLSLNVLFCKMGTVRLPASLGYS